MNRELLSWSIEYFKHKDLFNKKLINIKEKNNTLIFEYNDRNDFCLIIDNLNLENIKIIKINSRKYDKVFIVCTLLRKNIDFLIENWKEFMIKKLTLVFVDISIDVKVLLKPYIHNMICDQENLENAIRALFIGK
jgi:hypothetical protein